MALSNAALMEELQQAANGDLALLYDAIARTPEHSAGLFRGKTKRADDVKATIRTLLAASAASKT